MTLLPLYVVLKLDRNSCSLTCVHCSQLRATKLKELSPARYDSRLAVWCSATRAHAHGWLGKGQQEQTGHELPLWLQVHKPACLRDVLKLELVVRQANGVSAKQARRSRLPAAAGCVQKGCCRSHEAGEQPHTTIRPLARGMPSQLMVSTQDPMPEGTIDDHTELNERSIRPLLHRLLPSRLIGVQAGLIGHVGH